MSTAAKPVAAAKKPLQSLCFRAVLTVSGHDQRVIDPEDENPALWPDRDKQHARHDDVLATLMDRAFAAGATDFLIELIAQASRLPQSEWPEALPEPLPPEVTPLLKSLRAIGQREAETLGMAPELMLRKKILEALLKSGYPDGPYELPDSLRGWRRERMGQALLDALESA